MKPGNKWKTILALCAALGWWGALYPELCLTPDTYRVVSEESGEETGEPAETDGAKLYWELLGTDSSRIRFKSRLAEFWSELSSPARKESNDSAK